MVTQRAKQIAIALLGLAAAGVAGRLSADPPQPPDFLTISNEKPEVDPKNWTA